MPIAMWMVPPIFLVIEDHASEAINAEVGSDGEFSKITGAGVGIQLRMQAGLRSSRRKHR